jgi:hypothetical protein
MVTKQPVVPNISAAQRDRPAVVTQVVEFLFTLSVIFFLLAGLAIVVGQIFTLLQGDSAAARSWKTDLAPYAFGGASVAGIFAFLLSYQRHVDKSADGAAEHADHLG